MSFIMNHIVLIIVLELISIGMLLYFILKNSKEKRNWNIDQEEIKRRETADSLLKELSNEKRTTAR